MLIKDSTILVLGGWGLVGTAISHELMKCSPKRIIISSLHQSEAEEAVYLLRKEYTDYPQDMFMPAWGNIFTRAEYKTTDWGAVLKDDASRKAIISDIFDELDQNILDSSALYSLTIETKPDVVIDCINTATAIAYQNVYNTTRTVMNQISENKLDAVSTEKLMASLYIPLLIRHIQILYRSLIDAGVTYYIKVGTSGTGGMGLNIPYTHSEERPSRVLLAKAAVAGAQSLLLFLMARTPEGPIIKEIKPTAAIAWKKIDYNSVNRKGKPIRLVDMPYENAHKVDSFFKFADSNGVYDKGEDFKSVFIDTGENGIFSKGEFKAIGSLKQMEIVTPEEIAECVVFELKGGNSGHDIVQGLDSFSLGPTYRGGMLYNTAIKKLEELEEIHGVDSIAFEMLGPPRLSKLLYEAYILKCIAKSMKGVLSCKPEDLSKSADEIIKNESKLRSEMVSIGLVIMLSDGKSYLRGEEVKIPVRMKNDEIPLTPMLLNHWCEEGWVDLRPTNFENWQKRIKKIVEQAESVPERETSSRYTYTKNYWDNFEKIDEGKIVGWILEFEDQGWRFKR